jgi:GNAT superfamily N-acetyltransferase
MKIQPLTADRMPDLADLFASFGTTRGCWCTWFLLPRKEFEAGWRGGNQERFEEFAAGGPPAGLLAYAEGRAIGWCAVGPRFRYPRAIGPRSLMRGRDQSEDDAVWLVSCFFVRVGFRRNGVTGSLLDAAVELADRHGARAVEGFPQIQPSRDGFVGYEPVFASHGFRVIARPTPKRVIMRRELGGDA